MPFFIKAQSNESIVLKTYGIPINIARSWSIIPFPCCQVAKRFNLGRYNLQFECAEVHSKDDVTVSLIFSVKFVVDRSSKTKIMKAYKDFFGDEYDNNVNEIVNVETKVLEIIYKIVKKHAAKLDFAEIIKFNWLFVDSIFTEMKYVLKDSSVILEELTMDEIDQFTNNKNELIKNGDEINDTGKHETSQLTDVEDNKSKYNLPDIVINFNENDAEDNNNNNNNNIATLENQETLCHVTNKTVHLKQVSKSDENTTTSVNKHVEDIPIETESDPDEFDTISIISTEEKSLNRQVSVLYKDDFPTNFFIRGISVQYDNTTEHEDSIMLSENEKIVFEGRELNLPKPTVTEDGVTCAHDSPSLIIKRKLLSASDDRSLINVLNKENSSPIHHDECDNVEMYESGVDGNSNTKLFQDGDNKSADLAKTEPIVSSHEFTGYNLLLSR